MPLLQVDPKLLDAAKAFRKNPAAGLPALLAAAGAPHDVQLLLTPLGELKNEQQPELSAKLLDASGKTATTQLGWEWSAQADASLNLSMAPMLDAEENQQLGITPADGHVVMSYGAALSLTAGLSGQQGVGAWGQASANLSAGTDASLWWYVQAETRASVLEAAADAARYWLLPNDLDGLLRLAPDPMFWGLRLDLKAQLSAGLSVGAKTGWTAWTYGLDGARAGVGLSVGVDARLQLQHKGSMRLHVRPEQRGAAWGLKLELETLDAHDERFGVTLTAGLDLRALAASAERALRAGWPALDAKRLSALTQPGTALGAELGALIRAELANPDLEQLALLLFGQRALPEVERQLLERLTGPLVDVLDNASQQLATQSADAVQLARDWMERLLGQGPAAGQGHAALAKSAKAALMAATSAVDGAVRKLDGEIQAAQAKVKAGVNDALDQLLAPLGALGERLNQELARLDANPVSTAIAKALRAYNDARSQLLAALSDAKKAKLGITLSEQVQRSRNASLAFEGWFAPGGDRAAAQRLYQALCSGRIGLLGELVDAARAGGCFELGSGWLSETSKLVDSESALLSLFGRDFSSSRVSLIGMRFKADLWGHLSAADANVDIEAITKNQWLQRSVSLGVYVSLAQREGQAELSLSLKGAYAARGKSTTKAFVQHVVDDYAALLGARTHRDVGLLLNPPLAPESAKAYWRDLVLTLPVALNAQAWRRFEALDAAQVQASFLVHGLACLDQYYAGMVGFSHTSPSEVLKELADENFQGGGSQQARMLAYLGLYRPGHVSARNPDLDYANRVGIAVQSGTWTDGSRRLAVFHRFAAVLRCARTLHAAGPTLRAILLAEPTLGPPAVFRAGIEAPLKELRDALEAVAVASETISGIGVGSFDEGMTWAFNTFILAMAELIGQLPPGFLLMAAGPGDAQPVPLLLS